LRYNGSEIRIPWRGNDLNDTQKLVVKFLVRLAYARENTVCSLRDYDPEGYMEAQDDLNECYSELKRVVDFYGGVS
jgi:hypothetical protein